MIEIDLPVTVELCEGGGRVFVGFGAIVKVSAIRNNVCMGL